MYVMEGRGDRPQEGKEQPAFAVSQRVYSKARAPVGPLPPGALTCPWEFGYKMQSLNARCSGIWKKQTDSSVMGMMPSVNSS